ncbi:MAG: ABC transporter permease [Chromatiaceae bacterium]|nr:ABC transporter permease [Chromatiaceae bacterium]MCF7993335.1 ABC transporter permease [Chromatiaceae bacterium]MCF8014849.1 ABC transporter permease [Chromatiaceae bacterium]
MRLSNLSEAFWLKLHFGLKAEAAKNYLNYAWWLLEPALHVAVFYVVFGMLLERGGEDFIVFLLCGQIPFLWFSRSVTNAATSILGGKGLIQQMAIPKPFFPALVVAQDAVKQTVVFACLLLFIVVMGYLPGATWLVLPLIVLTQLLLVAACALLVAAITPFLPDFRFIVQTGMMMLMFASGIFYDYREVLPESQQSLFMLNPMAQLIVAYRDALIYGTWPDLTGLAGVALLSLVGIGLMLLFFRRSDAFYARLVIQ